MIAVLLGICIAMFIGGLIMFERTRSDVGEGVSICMIAVGAVSTFICLIATVCLGVNVSNLKVIDDKIAMYEEENTQIEEQVAAVVTQYQEYETDIFTELDSDSAITLVSLYPELKSDTLVQSQIDIYVQNNEKIKSLREQAINGTVVRWWLYFGGEE